MQDIIEQFDFKLQDLFVKRLEFSRLAGESAAQPFGDIVAILLSIYASGFLGLPKEDADKRFAALREVVDDVFATIQALSDEDRKNG
jgi:hypothetical protein